ncbi:thymidine kinase [Actinoalloteichus hoggarensis]|uniref:thymidine kinase n=1 Tax=Actinoalloteichus hoggarensis TaxID=1470176 RepID=UPI00179AC1D7|nr:thymidine kinase [Actinoalloteichus hoggarensis]MBB5923448.1 thymidine kinase [Actinoalloteichus hoggarensis]
MDSAVLADDPTDALSSLPRRSGRRAAGQVRFFYGPMDCGKSTLALQIDHNHARQGREGMLLVRHDRSGQPKISSRIGITRGAVEVDEDLDIRELVRGRWSVSRPVDYLIVDEAQFLTPAQVDQLAELADDVQVDVYCFGIATDFQSRLFPGSRRLFELADLIQAVQVEVLCWCGSSGRFNARVVDGRVIRAGDTVLVADTGQDGVSSGGAAGDGREPVDQEPVTVRYQVLCRRHFRAGDLGPIATGQGQLSLA